MNLFFSECFLSPKLTVFSEIGNNLIRALGRTMATWLVSVLREAGAMDTAGSTRAAAATWSAARGVNSSTIMAAADWSNVRTMQNHYIRLLPSNALNVEPSVQNAVLHL